PGTVSVDATGTITGVTTGFSTISYTLSATGCSRYAYVTVNPLPSVITGDSRACVGGTTTLHNAGPGVWSSANTSVATIISSGGYLTGVAAGTASITFCVPTQGAGCIATTVVTVSSAPAAGTISGGASIIGTASV